MKRHKVILLLLITGIFWFSCSKKMDVNSEQFKLLTDHIWVADSLLADKTDASGPGGLLEDFTGDTQFYEDGTGYLGIHQGTWYFSNDEKEITINTDSLPIPITATIVELTKESLKITTSFPSLYLPPVDIRMTFIAK